MRKILIVASVFSPQGGLQEHVLATVLELRRIGFCVDVCGRPGELLRRAKLAGCQVIECDFSSASASRVIAETSSYDLVHAHQWQAVGVGGAVAKKLNARLVVTIHGRTVSFLRPVRRQVAAVICVSPAIQESVILEHPMLRHRAVYIPNGVDTDIFSPAAVDRSLTKTLQIAVPSRFSPDKREMLSFLPAIWREQARSADARKYRWTLIGEGTELSRLKAEAASLEAVCGQGFVRSRKWMTPTELAAALNERDVVVGPGRSALEAMACGVPTIALGSAGCLGLMSSTRLLAGERSNFGGAGSCDAAIDEATAFSELRWLQQHRALGRELGLFVRAQVVGRFHLEGVNSALLSVYDACFTCN